MAPVTYRDRTPDDLGDAPALIERVFRQEFDLPLAEELAEDVTAAQAAHDGARDLFSVAEVDGRTAGALLVTHADSGEDGVLFSWLAVDPMLRGHGIGRELVARAVETCRQRRLVRLRARSLAISPAAPHLYWLYGFRVIEIVPTFLAGVARETLIFEKRLTPPFVTP